MELITVVMLITYACDTSIQMIAMKTTTWNFCKFNSLHKSNSFQFRLLYLNSSIQQLCKLQPHHQLSNLLQLHNQRSQLQPLCPTHLHLHLQLQNYHSKPPALPGQHLDNLVIQNARIASLQIASFQAGIDFFYWGRYVI